MTLFTQAFKLRFRWLNYMIKEQVKNKTSNPEATIRGCLYSSYNDDQEKNNYKNKG